MIKKPSLNKLIFFRSSILKICCSDWLFDVVHVREWDNGLLNNKPKCKAVGKKVIYHFKDAPHKENCAFGLTVSVRVFKISTGCDFYTQLLFQLLYFFLNLTIILQFTVYISPQRMEVKEIIKAVDRIHRKVTGRYFTVSFLCLFSY